MARSLLALISLVCVSAGAAALAPATAVGRVELDPPAASAGWVRVKTPKPKPSHVIAEVRPGHALALRSRPFGPVLARVGSRTPFGSQRALGVVATRHGRWLAVTDAAVGNNRVVWVDAKSGGLRYARTRLELDVDLSARTLTVRRNGAAVRRLSIGVGRAGSPTPTSRFPRRSRICPPAGRAGTASRSTAPSRRATSAGRCPRAACMRVTPICAT